MLVPVVPLVGIGRLDPGIGACREAGVCEPKWLFAEFGVCISGPKWPDVELVPGTSMLERCSAVTEGGADAGRDGAVSCGAQLLSP